MDHKITPTLPDLSGKTILITGAARRIGRYLALTCARTGAKVVIHHGHSPLEAEQTLAEIKSVGSNGQILAADLADPAQVQEIIPRALQWGPVDALVNNASIFEPLDLRSTTLSGWQRHLDVNLTAPFLLSQAFAQALPQGKSGQIVNILDWRALRPGADHLPYIISKAALAALTSSLALALAPGITVNGLALGAILPPSDGTDPSHVLDDVPAARWTTLEEVGQALLFLLAGPATMTGEIVYLDGGRHLV
jgi:NAD(P)-dependent dehydrogenase (short-subunit alcohol dehydrogenase family)